MKSNLKLLWIQLAIVILLIVGFLRHFDYRIPQRDKHPDWPLLSIIEIHNHNLKFKTNGDIVIESISHDYSTDSILNKIGFDTSQFSLPDSQQAFRNFIPNISLADSSVVLTNAFELGEEWGHFFSNTGGGAVLTNYDPRRTRFAHKTMDYYEIKIGDKKGYFKCQDKELTNIFQCNLPKTNKDSIYIYKPVNSLFFAYIKHS